MWLVAVCLLAVLFLPSWAKQRSRDQLDQYLEAGDFEAAEAFCDGQFDNHVRKAYFCRLADALLKLGKIAKASGIYREFHYREGFDRIGSFYFAAGNYPEAVRFFEEGTHSPKRARTYGLLADQFRNGGKGEKAKEGYEKAIAEYETLLKRFNYKWNETDAEDRRRCLLERKRFPLSEKEKADQALLDQVLERTAKYCQELNNASIYFFCYEAINEHISYSRRNIRRIVSALQRKNPRFEPVPKKFNTVSIRRKHLYEYQLLRDKPGEEAKETRELVKDNEERKRLGEQRLKTYFYRFSKVLFGPVGLLDKKWQRYFHYRFLEEEELSGRRVLVIEAIPLYQHKVNKLFGKIWVSADNYSILRIEWNPQAVKRIPLTRIIDENYWGSLKVSFVSEFDTERSGIRFPSRFAIEEAFELPGGERVVLQEVDVLYKDYQFFNVAVGAVVYDEKTLND